MCELCSPPLSSVAPNPEGIGYGAAEVLDALMAGKRPRQLRISVDPIRVFSRQSNGRDGCLRLGRCQRCSFYEGTNPSRLSLNRRASKG